MINAAVVGYGYAGRSFHAYLIGLAEGLNLYAISTRDPERRAAAAREHPEAKVYGDMEALLADGNVDLVVLATPHATHAPLAIQAMAAGKHVITDKVMCLNAAEAADMIAASRRNNVLLSVFHNRRWDWDYLTVRQVLADGLLGRPFLFESAVMGYGRPRGWRAIASQSGGVLYDWGAHLLDQALQVVPAPVGSVFCEIKHRDPWGIDIGNYAKLLLLFSNDVLYQIEVGNLVAVDRPRWYVLGDLGGLITYGRDPQEEAMREGHIELAEEDPANRAHIHTVANGTREERVIDSVRGSWTSYYQNISDVLNHGAELVVKPEQIHTAMRVYDAAIQSARTGQVVKL